MTAGASTREAVLITRSQPGADELAQALATASITGVVCPALTVRAVETRSAARLQDSGADFIVYLSRHAAVFAADLARARPHALVLAIGHGTARELARAGIVAEVPKFESSEGLLAMGALQEVAGIRILIVSGRGGRTLLHEELTRRGAMVERREVYERAPMNADALRAAWRDDIGVIAVASGEALNTVCTAAESCDLMREVRSCAAVVPSQRIADVAAVRRFRRVLVSEGSDAASQVDAIRLALARIRSADERK